MADTAAKYIFEKPLPWKHQVRGIRKVLSNQGVAALFVEMRLGKSRIAIDTACALAQQGKLQRVLIFCPYVSMGVWRREINKFAPATLKEYIDWRIVNYENAYSRATYQVGDGKRTWIPVDNEDLMEFKPDMLVCDESHVIANTNSVTHRKTYKIAKQAPYRLLLTGTPGEPEKIFGQWRILDESVFGSSMRAFQAEFCKMGGYMGKQVTGYRNEEKFRELIAPYMFQCREEDAWEVPPQRDEIVPVALMESREKYNAMLSDAVVKLKGEERVTAPIVLTQLLRLAQITSGHLPRVEGGKPRRVGREKEKAYRGLVRQLLDGKHTKIVTFCRFLPDIAVCARAAMAEGMNVYLLHGTVPSGLRDQRIAAFEESSGPAMFISQSRTGSVSVDLSSATDAIYYSLDYSLTTYEQSRARIRGHRQKGKSLTYWFLLCEGTVDEIAYLALKHKQDIVKYFMRHPQLLERTT